MTRESTSLSTAPPSNSPQTLLDVKMTLRVVELSRTKRADLVSALHAVAKTYTRDGELSLDEALSRIPVDAKVLQPLLEKRVGARLGYTRGSWSNIAWRVRAALKLTGAWRFFRASKISMSIEWQAITALLPAYSRVRLLGAWATLAGVSPHQFNTETAKDFRQWLQGWKSEHYTAKCYSTALLEWNKIVALNSTWNGCKLSAVNRLREHYSISLERWSPAFLADVDTVIAKFKDPDVDVDEFEPAKPLTVKSYRERLLRTMSAYVAATKCDPCSIRSISVLLDPKAAKIALDYMIAWAQRRKPEIRRSSEVHGSAKLLATIAERFFVDSVGAKNVLELKRMACRRSPIRKGMTEKNRELLKLFDDEKLIARFLHLPQVVFERVLKQSDIRRVDAVKLMLAFAVAQSIEAPMRPENQMGLTIGTQIFLRAERGTAWLAIRVPALEVKNTRDLQFDLSGTIVDLYEKYMEVARPILTISDNPYLYPGQGSGRKSGTSLSQQMKHFTADELGVPLTGQQFRHVIGYLYLKSHPGDYETVRELLGHTDISTTMSFYAALDMREASKRVGKFVAQQRADLAHLAGRRAKKKYRNA